MADETIEEKPLAPPPAAVAAEGGAAAYWQHTLWAMVGIQLVMAMANSMLSPIMPLVPAGARRQKRHRDRPVGRHPQRHDLVRRRLYLALVGLSLRPSRPQIDAAALERGDRVFHRADGRRRQCLAVLCLPRADGRLRRVFQRRDRAGREPGAGRAARLFSRLAGDRPAGRLADRPDHGRPAGRSDPQLPHPVLLHRRHDRGDDGAGMVHRARGIHPHRPRRRPSRDAQRAHRAGHDAGAAWRCFSSS